MISADSQLRLTCTRASAHQAARKRRDSLSQQIQSPRGGSKALLEAPSTALSPAVTHQWPPRCGTLGCQRDC